MSITSSLQCMSCAPSSTPVSPSVSSCSEERRMAYKATLVGIYCFAIDKFLWGETTSEAGKFAGIAAISSGVAERVASYTPQLYDQNQASTFDSILANSSAIALVGGGIGTVMIINEPYGKVSQTKQLLTVVFSELLADYMIKKYC